MTGIHLFVPMLHRHDAVGEHTRSLRERLVASGMESRIYTEIADPATEHETRHYLEYESEARAGDVLVYQFATASAMARWLAGRPERLVINYHSVTPPEFFAPWNDGITRLQVGARLELAEIAPRAALGIAVSRFDERELLDAGCPRTTVVPVANVADPPLVPDPGTVESLRARAGGSGGRWLSVGRLAPNKAHHHTIAALFVARTQSDPGAHLTVVGSPSEPAYAAGLSRYAAALGLAGAVDLVSGVDEVELVAHYRAADVLVMLSEHEGFGVPLIEAMGQGLPIVAFDAGAVPEVLGDAGVLLDVKSPRRVAETVDRLLADAKERNRLVEAGRARFSGMDLHSAGTSLLDALRGVAEPVAVPP